MNNILNPDLYHGKNKHNYFFEGWYFKLTDTKEDLSIALIPGIIKGKNQHSFIQYVNGASKSFKYFTFSHKDFISSDKAFNINIAGNYFSLEGIKINLQDKEQSIALDLQFNNIVRWPDSVINPGSMGFYNYLTFMECYSQVSAIDGYASGTILINEKEYKLTNSKIYIEKNWGKKFPYSWFWFQCNTFSQKDLALTCSIAHIPFPIYSFRGFLAAFRYKDEVITFTTMKRSKLTITRGEDSLSFRLSNRNYELIIEPKSQDEDFLLLHSPDGEVMKPDVLESIVSEIRVTLKEKSTGKILAEDTGIKAGIEYGGNYKELFD